MTITQQIFYILCFLQVHHASNPVEYFSSFAHMQALKHTEYRFIDKFNATLNDQQNRIKKLRTMIAEIKAEMLEHPVSQYKMLKRMAYIWPTITDDMLNGYKGAVKEFANQVKESGGTLGENELNGARDAIIRLQDTYLVPTKELSNGNVFGLDAGEEQLTAKDCYEIGRHAMLAGEMYYCMEWMRQAWRKFNEGDKYYADEWDILDHLTYALSRLNYRKFALQLNARQIEIIETTGKKFGDRQFEEHEKERNYKNRDFYKKQIALGNDWSEHFTFTYDLPIHKPPTNLKTHTEWWDDYQNLCRSKQIMPEESRADLFCFYDTQNGNPRLIFKPTKVEMVRRNPTKVIFHDFVTDEEILVLKALATDGLYRATVNNMKTGEVEYAGYRVQKNYWIKETEHAYVARINQRIADTTGLSMEYAEELQVANYGLAGQYEPHWDHSKRKTDENLKKVGNRIATVLIYMTAVEHGGHTIFLEPKLSIPPKKGSAAFWYNLKPSGASDDSTRHAGCPVLAGQKWVSNKWIHEFGNEFNRMCALDEEQESTFHINGWLGARNLNDFPGY